MASCRWQPRSRSRRLRPLARSSGPARSDGRAVLAAAVGPALATDVTCDVLVVGAGPAGAVAARAVARLGATVTLVDRSGFPRRKVCGGCLSRGAMDVLSSEGLGDIPARLGAPPVRALHLHAGVRRARLPLPEGRAVSRTALDEALVRDAVAQGVAWSPETGASLAERSRRGWIVRLEGPAPREIEAGVVVDATGLGVPLAPAGRGITGGDRPAERISRRARVGLGAPFVAVDYPVDPGALLMAVGRSGYVGLVRVESGALNVAAAVDAEALRRASPGCTVNEILVSCGLPPLGAPDHPWRGDAPSHAPTLLRRGPRAASSGRCSRLRRALHG